MSGPKQILDSKGATPSVQAKYPDVCELEAGATIVIAGFATSCSKTITARALSKPTDSAATLTYVHTYTISGEATTTTIIETETAAPQGAPTPQAETEPETCYKGLKRHDKLILWNGIPRRSDTTSKSFDWPFLNEVGAVTNAIMGLVTVEEESETGEDVDILLPE